MKKRLLAVLSLLLALLLASSAVAEPILTGGGYTAYIGQDNHFYLQDATGMTKVLKTPMADLLSIANEQVYCLTQAGQVYAIKVDGSATAIMHTAAVRNPILFFARKMESDTF